MTKPAGTTICLAFSALALALSSSTWHQPVAQGFLPAVALAKAAACPGRPTRCRCQSRLLPPSFRNTASPVITKNAKPPGSDDRQARSAECRRRCRGVGEGRAKIPHAGDAAAGRAAAGQGHVCRCHRPSRKCARRGSCGHPNPGRVAGASAEPRRVHQRDPRSPGSRHRRPAAAVDR